MRARPRRRLGEEIATGPVNCVLMTAVIFLMATTTRGSVGRLNASPYNVYYPWEPPHEGLTLHLRLRGGWCVTSWRDAGHELRRAEAPCTPRIEHYEKTAIVRVRYDGLAAALAAEAEASPGWTRAGAAGTDELVVHVDDDVTFAHIIAALDEAMGVKRTATVRGEIVRVPAFHVSFAAD